MAGMIDSTLDELETQLRALKRELSRLEAFRRQLELAAEDKPRGDAGDRHSRDAHGEPT
jgi:hypothetical protein